MVLFEGSKFQMKNVSLHQILEWSHHNLKMILKETFNDQFYFLVVLINIVINEIREEKIESRN